MVLKVHVGGTFRCPHGYSLVWHVKTGVSGDMGSNTGNFDISVESRLIISKALKY